MKIDPTGQADALAAREAQATLSRAVKPTVSRGLSGQVRDIRYLPPTGSDWLLSLAVLAGGAWLYNRQVAHIRRATRAKEREGRAVLDHWAASPGAAPRPFRVLDITDRAEIVRQGEANPVSNTGSPKCTTAGETQEAEAAHMAPHGGQND